MASKLFVSAKALLARLGMAELEAHYVARLANGHASDSGLTDVRLEDAGVKSSSKGFTSTVKASVKRDLKKGELLTNGEVAWMFVISMRDNDKAFPGCVRQLALPTGLVRDYREFEASADGKSIAEGILERLAKEEEAEAKAKAEEAAKPWTKARAEATATK